MSAPDFAAILAAEGEATNAGYRPATAPGSDAMTVDLWPHIAASQLAAKVPELCPSTPASDMSFHGGCPDCPTIAHLLAIGALTYHPWTVNDFGAEAWGHVQGFIGMLRSVQP